MSFAFEIAFYLFVIFVCYNIFVGIVGGIFLGIATTIDAHGEALSIFFCVSMALVAAALLFGIPLISAVASGDMVGFIEAISVALSLVGSVLLVAKYGNMLETWWEEKTQGNRTKSKFRR
jgi:hypothetical protein